MSRRHGQDVAVWMKREARDGLAEIEPQDALGRPRVPNANLVVQGPGRQDVRVARVEPDDPRRAPVSRERGEAFAGGAVDELDGVVSVGGREGSAVGGERRGDGGPWRRAKFAVRGGAVAQRVSLGPRR